MFCYVICSLCIFPLFLNFFKLHGITSFHCVTLYYVELCWKQNAHHFKPLHCIYNYIICILLTHISLIQPDPQHKHVQLKPCFSNIKLDIACINTRKLAISWVVHMPDSIFNLRYTNLLLNIMDIFIYTSFTIMCCHVPFEK